MAIAEYEAGRKDLLQTAERLLSIQPTPWRAIADFHARHSLFLEAR